jgi:ABC-type multidrug transport system ATPase subunit
MAKGRIQAYGDSTSLKSKFGAGYKLSIMCEPEQMEDVKQEIYEIMPKSKIEDDAAGALLYEFPNSCLSQVSKLVQRLNINPYVRSWGLSQTTLEQVFLTITRKFANDKKEV